MEEIEKVRDFEKINFKQHLKSRPTLRQGKQNTWLHGSLTGCIISIIHAAHPCFSELLSTQALAAELAADWLEFVAGVDADWLECEAVADSDWLERVAGAGAGSGPVLVPDVGSGCEAGLLTELFGDGAVVVDIGILSVDVVVTGILGVGEVDTGILGVAELDTGILCVVADAGISKVGGDGMANTKVGLLLLASSLGALCRSN